MTCSIYFRDCEGPQPGEPQIGFAEKNLFQFYRLIRNKFWIIFRRGRGGKKLTKDLDEQTKKIRGVLWSNSDSLKRKRRLEKEGIFRGQGMKDAQPIIGKRAPFSLKKGWKKKEKKKEILTKAEREKKVIFIPLIYRWNVCFPSDVDWIKTRKRILALFPLTANLAGQFRGKLFFFSLSAYSLYRRFYYIGINK